SSAPSPSASRKAGPAPATRTPTSPAAPTTGPDRRDTSPAPAPQGTAATTPAAPAAPAPDPGRTEDPVCRVSYDLAGQWPDGFQATVTVHTERALDDWRVAWSFPDGQRVNQMWDATYAQDGSRVTARAADYNKTVPADGTLSFGFLASWQGRNAPAYDFTLDGRPCAAAGEAG
ncbi:MAG TPA: cellulose-binding domain-containing protein, partial [Streptomyces sp.]|nr:cellulose-binding domain-containing protein [Streptomyces sp.]